MNDMIGFRSNIPIILAIFFASSCTAWAGGAVMAVKQRPALEKQRQLQQQKIIQQRMIQEQLLRQQEVELEIIKTEAPPEEIKDVVDINDIFKSLETSSRAWTLMIDNEAKEAVVQHFINKFRADNAIIRKPAGSYVAVIDGMAAAQPAMLQNPFENVLRIVAIMEYDFDIGQDKDALARQLLGEQAFIENKKRLQQSSR